MSSSKLNFIASVEINIAINKNRWENEFVIADILLYAVRYKCVCLYRKDTDVGRDQVLSFGVSEI